MLSFDLAFQVFIFSKKEDDFIMKKKELPPYKLYSLIPSQQSMYLMVKYSFHKQLVQIPTAINVDFDIDFELLKKAFDIEVQRNDSLRNRFVQVDGMIKQYFVPKAHYDIEFKHFASKDEQEAFFSKDAQRAVKFLKDETFRMYFYKTDGVGCGIYSNVSHLIMDAMGIVGMYFDLLRVYEALAKNEEMPAPLDKYEDYIVEEFKTLSNKKKMAKHEKFYKDYFLKGGEPFYAAVHGPQFLEAYRKKKKNNKLRVPEAYSPLYDKSSTIIRHIDPQDAEKIFSFCKERLIAPESLFQLGLRTHCSAINYRVNDVFMMTICSKRASKKEKNMSGCLAQPLQLRTIISEDSTFSDALKEMVSVRTSLYRHASYPYITARDLSRDIYNYNLIQGPACMMYSWIPLPLSNMLPFKLSFKFYDPGRYFSPLYTITAPDPSDSGINVYYMYRCKLSTPEQINALHDNMLKTILKGIENPDITIGELLDSIS